MPEISIDANDLENFSKKLQGLEISTKEAALLSGIFAVAADAISPTGDGVGTTDLVKTGGDKPVVQVDDAAPPLSEQFHQQFRSAFVAEPAARSVVNRPAIIVPAPAPAPPGKVSTE